MKTLLTALTLTVLPTFAFAMGCSFGSHETTAQMSCAEGTAFDAETGTCVPVTTS